MFRVSSEEHPPGDLLAISLRAWLDLCTADGQQETVDHSGHTRSLGQETEQPGKGRRWENRLLVQDRVNRTDAVEMYKVAISFNRSQPQMNRMEAMGKWRKSDFMQVERRDTAATQKFRSNWNHSEKLWPPNGHKNPAGHLHALGATQVPSLPGCHREVANPASYDRGCQAMST
jgi:hypothetical protein